MNLKILFSNNGFCRRSDNQMKRVMTFIMAAAIAVSCGTSSKTGACSAKCDDGQKEFFGCKFGDSPSVVIWKMGGNKGLYTLSQNEYLFKDREFAGLTWEFVSFFFNSKKQFSRIVFSTHSKLEESIQKRFDFLSSILSLKYPALQQNIGVNNWSYTEETGDKSVFLTKTRGESRGGEVYWYCILEYSDETYMKGDRVKAFSDL